MAEFDTADSGYLKQVSRIMHNAARSARPDSGQDQLSVFLGDEFCRLCATPNNPGYNYCPRCNALLEKLPLDQRPDHTGFLTYAVKGEQSGRDIYKYKGEADGRGQVADSQLRMQILVYLFVQYHASCLKTLLGKSLTGVATVPSGQGRENHPLQTDLAGYFTVQLPSVSVERVAQPRQGRDVQVDPNRYRVHDDIEGQHVVVLEDTWVTGAQVLGVAAALKNAGATVSILCVARLLDPEWRTTSTWLEEAGNLPPYEPLFCPVTRSFNCPA